MSTVLCVFLFIARIDRLSFAAGYCRCYILLLTFVLPINYNTIEFFDILQQFWLYDFLFYSFVFLLLGLFDWVPVLFGNLPHQIQEKLWDFIYFVFVCLWQLF